MASPRLVGTLPFPTSILQFKRSAPKTPRRGYATELPPSHRARSRIPCGNIVTHGAPPMSSDRREFLQAAGVAGAALLSGRLTETARGFAANDTLQIGLIGTGG